MSRLQTAFVLGYHGCDRSVADAVIAGKSDLLQSERGYDWLGPGAYFWEFDPQRAFEWAEVKVARKQYDAPGVIGAVIDLRNCLDLVARENLELVLGAFESFAELRQTAGVPMPKNEPAPSDPTGEPLLRYLDCAVIQHLHQIIEEDGKESGIEPYDTVRGMFDEGEPLYPTSGFRLRNHVQIAVRNMDCILGLFHPRTARLGEGISAHDGV